MEFAYANDIILGHVCLRRTSLQWRHECDDVSNHHCFDCLLNSKCRSKKTSWLRITGLCAENPSVDYPLQRSSNAKNIPYNDVIIYMCDLCFFLQTAQLYNNWMMNLNCSLWHYFSEKKQLKSLWYNGGKIYYSCIKSFIGNVVRCWRIHCGWQSEQIISRLVKVFPWMTIFITPIKKSVLHLKKLPLQGVYIVNKIRHVIFS